MFGFQTRDSQKLLVCRLSWWSSYEGSRVHLVPTSMVFAYHFTSVLLAERRSPLFLVAATEQCVFARPSFFKSTSIRCPAEYMNLLKSATAFAECVVLLPQPSSVHAFAVEV